MFNLRHTFAAKLLVLLAGLVAAAQFATWLIVSRTNETRARALIDVDLRHAAAAFASIVADRNALLADGGATAARDYAIKPLFANPDDPATLASALTSITLSIRADLAIAVSLDGLPLASTLPGLIPGGVLASLIRQAELDESPNPRATGYGYHSDHLHSLVLVPVRSPEIVAWLVLGFRIDNRLTDRLRDQTGVDVTFTDQDGRLIVTTLKAPPTQALLAQLPRLRATTGVATIPLAADTALVTTRELPAGDGRHALLVLQYSLDEKLAPAKATERILLYVTIGGLMAALILGLAFARRLSQPIEQLAAHTRIIARGDYTTPLTLQRADELGRLADAFRAMTVGLSERDRVRDLLDKNVSPEVAAQLLRDGAILGGQEREVTILFADLRGFTTLSEKLTPHELLTLLNRYLDRMSAAIEAHGGVIDKFIGDAIMALFGAPVTQSDAAHRALAAALAMEKALVQLNTELAAEGIAPLAIGIGVNTARVVAGNIGSSRRLNYSVIGDGVNVASRLQSLTRTAEYRTSLIASAATLAACHQSLSSPPLLVSPARPSPTFRPLGTVPVKGRAEPVEIFAVE